MIRKFVSTPTMAVYRYRVPEKYEPTSYFLGKRRCQAKGEPLQLRCNASKDACASTMAVYRYRAPKKRQQRALFGKEEMPNYKRGISIYCNASRIVRASTRGCKGFDGVAETQGASRSWELR